MKPKSLREFSLNIPEQEYHDYPAWSQSIIARYAREGFSSLTTLHDKVAPTPSMEFGSLFDSMITRGKETMKHYVVFDMSIPPAEKNVLDVLASNCTCPQFHDISMDEVIATADNVSYQPRLKTDTRYKKISEYSTYYDTIKSGKKIISQKDWEDAVEMYKVFRNDEYLKTLFGTKDTDDVEYIYQAQFKTTFVINDQEVEVKMMADLIVVNHTEKTIQIVDLKTSAMPAYDFSQNFLKYRYDLEAEVYTDVLDKILIEVGGYSDYEILPFLFTDISRVDKVPVTYYYEPTVGLVYTKGDKTYSYKGWKELLSEILYYEEVEAKVPLHITTKAPNDLIEILER